MTHVQKGAKYTLKNLLGKTREENDLRMKVLRYVMAVGFVLSPWLGGEAYADAGNIVRVGDATNQNLMQNGVAHIYAEQVDTANKVGFNRFQTFNVAAGEIANLYFQKEAGGATLNSLVNTVESQISISGMVNAIRNNKIGGNLYFVSPNGMVVGSTGVINAGALTAVVPASLNYLQTLQQAVDGIKPEGPSISGWGALAEYGSIVINGQINTATGINLEAQTIQITKVSGSTSTPSLLTGVAFEKIVNTDGIDTYRALPIANNRLIAYKDEETNKIIVADPSNLENATGDELLQGDGRIRVYARKAITGEGLHGTATFTEGVVNAIGDVAIESGQTIEIDKPTSGTTPSSTANKTSITSGNQIKLLAETGDIYNAGTIVGANKIDASAGFEKKVSNYANIINYGTIQSTNGGMSLATDRLLTNNGTIEANDQIAFTVGGTLTNQGTIESTSSNVQAHIGRNFKNIAVYDNESSENRTLIGGIIEAGGNVQVDYNLDTEHTDIGVATPEPEETGPIDGIYNSGLIQANGNEKPESEGGVVDMNSGSGNIWLTSSYNITNYGNMIAGRQITLNARDFLHNHGTIQGVTYLDIKSIMGYVYNHNDGVIRATGGNIDLSSGQANLQIDGDTNGQKKELYRKFTPIIIEGLVQATSDDDESNQTRKGNIQITAHLGDIYINGGTIETKPELGTNKEVKAEAGDVILDAAQNITIGFETVKAWADDPTTDGANYNNSTEREYYKPISDSNLVPSSPSQNAAQISGSNITLTSGSGKTISMSTVNNTLTASKAITINTNSMDIVGGTFNANTLAASKNLNIAGGTINTNNITAGITAGVNNGGQLTITGGTINVANVTANGALTLTGGTVGRTDSSLSIIGTGDVSIGSDAIVRTSSDVSIASDEGTVTNNSELNISGSVSLSGKTDVTNSANITAGKDVSMTATTGKVNNSKVIKANGGNINLTGGTSINLQEGYGLEASDTINLTTDNMQITSGTIKANTLAASEALTLTGGTINAANISAGTNLIHSGATITADNEVTISAGNNINLQSGRLTANGAAFVVTNGTAGANSIVEGASGYNLGVGSLSLSANQGNITFKGTDNVLQSVTLADVGGNVEIVNGNGTNKNVLTVSTAEGTTVGGIINIVNKGEGITVAGINATNNVSLTADKGIAVTGSFTTTGDVVLDADTYISIAGDVNAANASFGAGVDFIHNGGAIAAGEVVVTAGQSVQLNGGSMVAAKSASLTANAGSIAEQDGYAIDAPQVTLSAAKYADLDSTANQLVNVNVTKVGGDLTIGSGNKKNTDNLQVDVVQKVDGNLTLKNYSVAGDENANSIVVAGALSATKNITITNAEANINVGTSATVNAANISLEANSGAVNVTGDAVITTANTGTLTANANNIIIAGGQITAGTATITSNGTANSSGFTMNGGTITAGTANITSEKAINQTAGSIVATNTVATAGGDLGLASTYNKLQNVTVTAANGSVTIVSGNDEGNALNVHANGTIGGTLSITNVDDGVVNGVDNAIVIDNNLLANGDITITNQEAGIELGKNVVITSQIGSINISAHDNFKSQGLINAFNSIILEAINRILDITSGSITAKGGSIALHGKGGINNGASISAKGNVGLYSTDGKITNSADITAGKNFASATRRAAFYSLRAVAQEIEETGSVTMSGKDGVTNTASASVSAEQSVSMTSTAGGVNNSSVVTSNSGTVVISGQTGVTNEGSLTATTGSVTMSGNGDVTNTATITAGTDVSMSSTTGDVQNSGTIAADQSVGMTATAGAVTNSNNVNAGTGTVTMSGKMGVVNDNTGATISAGSGVSMTSSAEGVINSSTVTSTSGVVEMDGQKAVTNTGAVTATGGSVEISGSKVANTGAVKASGGSVTMSGSGGVDNSANITAKDSVSMTSSAGAVDNSNAITVSNGSVTMTGQTSVKNEGELKATGGSVEISGNDGVTNKANITANKNVNISAGAGAITNNGSVTAETGNIDLNSNNGIIRTDEGSSSNFNSLNGSISAVTTYGEVNISEINAGKTASVSSEKGSVIIGSVSGNDVVLSSGPSSSGGSGDGSGGSSEGGSVVTSSSIKVSTAKVDNSLKLQGDNIDVSNVVPDDNTKSDPLNIDVSGADGAGSAVQGSLDLNITGDVVFDNLNVTDANVTASGNIDVNKLRVEGEGKTELVSNKKNENDEGTTITVVGKDVPPEQVGNDVIRDTGSEGDTWLNIKMDEEGSKTTVVDDAGRDVNNKDYPAQMSAKLVDYDPYDTYLDHYADMADIFSRSYLIDIPERSSSDILSPVQGGRVVLKQDANGLHLEISEEEQEA